jgi:hypothetical protein
MAGSCKCADNWAKRSGVVEDEHAFDNAPMPEDLAEQQGKAKKLTQIGRESLPMIRRSFGA